MLFLPQPSHSDIVIVISWLKRSLSQSIGSFSCNPHFALFLPGQRSDIFGNVSNHWGMVTYNFFRNIFFGSLIRTCTGSFANVCEGTSPLYMKVGQILRSENRSWALVDACPFFFCGSLIRAHTGSFGDVPKFCDLLVKVGHMTKWWVCSCSKLFGSNFLGSLIRTHTGSFANVFEGTSPLYMKVGQILRLSENGSWALVDAHPFFWWVIN